MVIFLALLAGCGGETEDAPQLAAIPTRTPVPQTGEAAPDALDNVTVTSLGGEVDDFLVASLEASPLDRIDLFREHVFTPTRECFEATHWPDWDPLQMLGADGLNLVSLDLQRWRDALDAFPDDQAVAVVTDALGAAERALPWDRPVRVCLLPVPGAPQGNPRDPQTDAEPVDGGVSSEILGGDLALITCSAGEACLDTLAAKTVYVYGYLIQVAQSGLNGIETPLLAMAVQNARAAYLARQVVPGASFPWEDALTPQQEETLWDRMQADLSTSYQDYPAGRSLDHLLYGTAASDAYPLWGGLYIGERIVQAYVARHPDVSLEALMDLDPQALYEQSGYVPREPETE